MRNYGFNALQSMDFLTNEYIIKLTIRLSSLYSATMHCYIPIAFCLFALLELTNGVNEKESSTYCVSYFNGVCWDKRFNMWPTGK